VHWSVTVIKLEETSARLPSSVLSKGLFRAKITCGSAKFGEDIVNRSQAVQWKIFSTAVLTLTCQKLILTFGTDAEHPCQIS